MSRIGEKIILWRTEFSSKAYKDQLGIFQSGYVVLGEYETTIVEERNVPNTWGMGTSTGLMATTEDGIKFTCNWNSFPDDSMTPTYFWDVVESSGKLWKPVDAIQAVSTYPHVDAQGRKKLPSGGTQCENHNVVYMESCWKCDFDFPSINSFLSD